MASFLIDYFGAKKDINPDNVRIVKFWSLRCRPSFNNCEIKLSFFIFSLQQLWN